MSNSQAKNATPFDAETIFNASLAGMRLSSVRFEASYYLVFCFRPNEEGDKRPTTHIGFDPMNGFALSLTDEATLATTSIAPYQQAAGIVGLLQGFVQKAEFRGDCVLITFLNGRNILLSSRSDPTDFGVMLSYADPNPWASDFLVWFLDGEAHEGLEDTTR